MTATDTVATEIAQSRRRGRRPWWANVVKQILSVLGFGLAVVLLLQLLTVTGVISPFVLPRPTLVLERFWELLVEVFTGGPTLRYVGETAFAMVVSLVVSVVLGILIGTILSLSTIVKTMVYPYVLALNAAPRVVFAPMFVIWFGLGPTSRIVMGVSIAMFPVIVATLAGLSRSDANLERLMKATGATRLQRFLKVDLPGALPFVAAGAETAAVLVTVGVNIGEFTSGSSGLGYLIVSAQATYNLPSVFALVMLTSVLGILMTLTVAFVSRRVVFWGRRS